MDPKSKREKSNNRATGQFRRANPKQPERQAPARERRDHLDTACVAVAELHGAIAEMARVCRLHGIQDKVSHFALAAHSSAATLYDAAYALADGIEPLTGTVQS